jgi:ribosomal-protein-alanine N-acetyltransferase
VAVAPVELRTERLVLRRWRPEDRHPFAALNADPAVVRHLPGPLTRAESDALAERIEAGFAARGYGLWAVEVEGGAPFVGYVGLEPVTFASPVAGRTEIGWRLASQHWGRGYATEAAREVLRSAFEDLGLDEVVSFTVPANRPSLAVMARIGLRRRPDLDFDHPRLAPGDPLRSHVVWALAAATWRDQPPLGQPRTMP